MIDDRPSGTAVIVSFARAVATMDHGAPGEGLDPFARRLLPAPLQAILGALASASRFSSYGVRAARLLSLGLVDHCELRSLAIDAVAREALSSGAAQLVILGAGLDTRAWRLPEVSKVTAYEVDHPATQRYKRRRAGQAAHAVHFVAVDFERDSLDARLAEAGHDPKASTLWIWEGVTPYLLPEATEATLAIIAGRSAKGSTLAMTYVTPGLINVPAPLMPLLRRGFSLIGEPLRGEITTERLDAMLRMAGLRLEGDSDVNDWIARFSPRNPPRLHLTEHLAVARV